MDGTNGCYNTIELYEHYKQARRKVLDLKEEERTLRVFNIQLINSNMKLASKNGVLQTENNILWKELHALQNCFNYRSTRYWLRESHMIKQKAKALKLCESVFCLINKIISLVGISFFDEELRRMMCDTVDLLILNYMMSYESD